MSLTEIGRTIKLPGFRPGKVPVNLVRQRYGASVMAEVMQDALNTATDQVVEERGLRPAGQPKVELAGEPKIDGKAASDLAFSMEMELLPEIGVPDLSSIQPDAVAIGGAARGDRQDPGAAGGQAARDRIRSRRTGAPRLGEVLTVDFVGTVDGVPFEGGAGQDAKVEIGGTGFIPGFSEGHGRNEAGRCPEHRGHLSGRVSCRGAGWERPRCSR